ncbi:MAG: polysaccharide deacetylase family protein [Bacteroidia bacterium]
MLLIYTRQLTPRIHFVFELLLKDLVGVTFQLTTDENQFRNYEAPKFSYSNSPLENELFFQSVDLLFENEIKNQNIEVFEWNSLKSFYKITTSSVLPFDVFAASFYLVSRYEEYLPYTSDEHGRFPATRSLAYRNNFLQQPLVNQYASELKKILKEKFPQLVFAEKKFEFISTIDIDNAYAYIGKGLYRTTGAIARSVLKFDVNDLKLRSSALIQKSADPYDTYSYYFQLQSQYNFKSIFFFLLGDFTEHDKNLPYSSKRFQSLIKSIAAENEIGIHPSYSSNNKAGQLQKEIERLKNITGKPVTKSRQHFLKMQLPETYRQLIAAGITDDYTMGYAEEAGFRAGICSPYYFFDLKKNECTNLHLHPFAVMDATLNSYMKLPTNEAISLTKKLIDEVKSVNGTFISLWHNETISETGIWKTWRNVFEFTVKYASSL